MLVYKVCPLPALPVGAAPMARVADAVVAPGTPVTSALIVMLPAPLLAVAGLGREVALIGAGNRLEIWNRDAWAAEHGDLLQTVKDIRPGSANGHTA